MACSPAPAATALLADASARWPNRRRGSDGICASAQHSIQNPTSSHETGDAVDLTHDPANGVDCGRLSREIINDPRVSYVIFNRQIWSRSNPTWRPYPTNPNRRANPHTTHMHVDLVKALRNDRSPWFGSTRPAGAGAAGTESTPPKQPTGVGKGVAPPERNPLDVLTSGATWTRVLGVIVALVLIALGAVILNRDLIGDAVSVVPVPVPR